MGEDPRAIRKEIEDTRERMGDTVDALAYKADVKSRAKDSVNEKVDSLKAKVTGAKDSVADATPSGGDVKQGARQAVGIAQENPLGLAIGAAAIGFVAGMLIPSTARRGREDRPRRRPGQGEGRRDRPAGPRPRQAGRLGRRLLRRGDREGERSRARAGRRRGRPAGGTGDPRRGALLLAMWRRASGASGRRSRSPRAAPARCSRAPEEQSFGEQPRRCRAPGACVTHRPSARP